MSRGSGWTEVSKAKPCPACGDDHYCAWTPDNKRLRCMGEGQAPAGMVHAGDDKNGGRLFKFAGDVTNEKKERRTRGRKGSAAPKPSPSPAPEAESKASQSAEIDWRAEAERCVLNLSEDRREAFARSLGVPIRAFATVPVGWARHEDLRRYKA